MSDETLTSGSVVGRRGDWMQTFSGRAFWPLDPRPGDISVADISHALSLLCRYGGHTSRFYSVAEHSVLMSHVVAPEHALWALLHDAAEAYLCDLPRPIKRLMPTYQDAEDVLLFAIRQKFGLGQFPREVRDADNRILLDERAALMVMPPPLSWGDLEDMEPLGVEVYGWSPAVAEHMWITRFHALRAAPEASS